MLTPEQVAEIWRRQWGVIKPFVDTDPKVYDGYIHPDKEGELPEAWPGFAASWWQREGLLPHIEHGVFPDALFAKRAPNQTEAEFEYVKDNYKQVTLPVASDYFNTIGRAIAPSNWSVEWQDDDISQRVYEYTSTAVPEWGSFEAYVRRILIRLKTEDAMGVIATLPKEVPVMEGEDGLVIDPNEPLKPEPMYFESGQVWGFEYDKWYLLRLNVSSEVTYGGKPVPGVLCWLVDDENVWRIQQVGKKTDWEFDITLELPHMAGEAPVIHLGGSPVLVKGQVAFESPYLAAKEVLDTALTDAQWLQVSKVKCVYPHIVMVGDVCEFYDATVGARCYDGKVEWTDADGRQQVRVCPSCHGTGKKRRLSPTGELIINPAKSPDDLSAADGVNATNALAFVAPSTETVEFIRSEVERNIEHARSIMHLGADKPMDGGDAKTATEAGLNNRAKDAFVKPIADQLLWIYEFMLKMSGRMIAGREWDGLVIRKQSRYDLRTDADIVAEISAAREHGLPPAVIDEMEGDLIASKYANDRDTTLAMEVIQRADRLARMSPETIMAEAAAGRVKAWEILLHYSALDIYRELVETDATFAALESIWDRVRALQSKAMERAPEASRSAGAMNRLAGIISQ